MGLLIHIKADGKTEERIVSSAPDLEELQQMVGGYIEVVWVRHKGRRTAMIVNEDGYRLGLSVNPRASQIYQATALFVGQTTDHMIVGDAVILEGVSLE